MCTMYDLRMVLYGTLCFTAWFYLVLRMFFTGWRWAMVWKDLRGSPGRAPMWIFQFAVEELPH